MFGEVAEAMRRGEAVALVTVVRVRGATPCAPGARLLVRADGRLVGTLGGARTDERARDDALAALASGDPALLTYHLDPDTGESVGSCGATVEVFVEPVRPEPRLLVAGSGYVAQALARLAASLGWHITLLDDRSELLRAATLPAGVESAVGEMGEQVTERRPDRLTAVVIVTRGHHSDQAVLRSALATDAGYIGMIGSRSKVQSIFRALIRDGAAEEALARGHAPIGLDLRAETPDEIALSIAAELLLWRRGGTGRPLKDVAGIAAQARAAEDTHAAT
jgi:xanthine dehydrogenase accessory factor